MIILSLHSKLLDPYHIKPHWFTYFMQSYFGANVLHPRTIIPVMKDNIPIVIRNMFNLSASGTMICKQPANENGDLDACVKSFATIDNLALVNVEG